MADSLSLPEVWDERIIGQQLVQASKQSPAVLAHYVDAVKERFIRRQDAKTAIVNIEYFKRLVEAGHLARDYKGICNDLEAMKLEQQIRLGELEVKKLKLDGEKANIEEIERLKRELEKERLQLEMAKLRKEKEDLQGSREPKLSSEQQRRLKRIEIEDRLRELDRLEEEALKNARSDEDRVRVQNMYADKREELREQLSRYLV